MYNIEFLFNLKFEYLSNISNYIINTTFNERKNRLTSIYRILNLLNFYFYCLEENKFELSTYLGQFKINLNQCYDLFNAVILIT